MIEINGKQLCENCFEETNTPFCTHCGYNAAATASDPTMLRPGNILLGKYIVGKVMGKGGFGVTYLAYDVTMGRKVAIKEFFPYGVALRAPGTTTVSVASMDNADAFKLGAEKFYNEAQLVSRFNGNPNIVGVYEFFYENDTVYFAMEYLKGHTLKEHIEQTGPLTSEQGLFVMQNVANALMAAHSSNVLHRDISPDNIIVCDNGDIKLIDFGAARQVVAEHSQSFSVILKPGFAPLEQYQKKGHQGPWTDIYSLGATIYYSLTEDIPEDPMSRMDDDEEYASNKYNIDPELWDVISRATELKISDRYGDVFQLKNDLANVSYAAEPLVVPTAPENKMPEFQTAMPFGMTQHTAPQPANQPVGVGAPAQMPTFTPVQMQQTPTPGAVQAPAPVQAQAPAPAPENTDVPTVHAQKLAPNESGAPAKKGKGKIAGICAGVAAAVAAAIIIPVAVNSNRDQRHYIDNTSSTRSTRSSSTEYSTYSTTTSTYSAPASTTTRSSYSAPASSSTPTPSPSLSSKILYSGLSSTQKSFYEKIYNGFNNFEKRIDFTGQGFTYDDFLDVYYMVLDDNPLFFHVGSYSFNYNDTNNNGSCDFGEIINYLTIDYGSLATASSYKTALSSLNTKIDNIFANSKAFNNNVTIGKLLALHDQLANVTVTNENGYGWYSAYGSLMTSKGNQYGIASAFCYGAQRLGLKCVVVEGNITSRDYGAWCRVQVDGTWYNVDVYGDILEKDVIKKMSVNSGVHHTYFLTNDTFMTKFGYKLYTQYNFLLESSYAANSKHANFYIQDNGEGGSYSYFYDSVDAAYNRIVEWWVQHYNDSKKTTASICVKPDLVDGLFAKINSSIVSDIKKKGINVSNGKARFYPDESEFELEFTVS